MNTNVKKAVIPAAGKGSRFLPITKACAKELLPIIDRPVLDYILDEVIDSGIDEVLIIVSPDKENIKSYYSPSQEVIDALVKSKNFREVENIRRREGIKISFVTQEVANGSGAAMLLAEEFTAGQPFAVLLGDDVVYNPDNPVASQLIAAHQETGGLIVGVQRRLGDDIYKYGIVDVESEEADLSKMRAILEKPTKGSPIPSRKCSLGRYVFTPDIYDAIRRTPLAKNGELQLTDSINLLCGEGNVFAYCFSGRRYDMGDKLGSLEGIVEYGLRHEDFGKEFKEYLLSIVGAMK